MFFIKNFRIILQFISQNLYTFDILNIYFITNKIHTLHTKKMGRKKENKTRINITVDVDILVTLKNKGIQASTLINNLLRQHLSLYTSHTSLGAHNPEVEGSNPSLAIANFSLRSKLSSLSSLFHHYSFTTN